jgi:hypothetical protein
MTKNKFSIFLLVFVLFIHLLETIGFIYCALMYLHPYVLRKTLKISWEVNNNFVAHSEARLMSMVDGNTQLCCCKNGSKKSANVVFIGSFDSVNYNAHHHNWIISQCLLVLLSLSWGTRRRNTNLSCQNQMNARTFLSMNSCICRSITLLSVTVLEYSLFHRSCISC